MPGCAGCRLTQLTSYRADLMGDGVTALTDRGSAAARANLPLGGLTIPPTPLGILVADLGTPAEASAAGIDGVTGASAHQRCLPCRY